MKKSMIIVGGGIAGLSAGCYAQMNGFNTCIFEMHSIPGGLCTAWERKGYKFDISMHMLSGSDSGPFNQMWRELGVIDNFDFHYHEKISQVEGKGKKLLYSINKKEMEEAMLALSPQDEDLIREFTDLIFSPTGLANAFSLKPAKLRNLRDTFRTMGAVIRQLKVFRKYGKISLQEFAARFKDPFLRKAIQCFVDSPGWPMPQFPMVVLSGFMDFGVKNAGVPLGGSQQVVFQIADLYKRVGGNIHLKSRVTNLIIENKKVKGIELSDGSRHMADHVIWAGDGHTLIYDILEGKNVDKKINTRYESWKPVKSVLHVMLGVNMDMSDEPHTVIFQADKPVTVAGREYKWLHMLHHCFDKSMAPEGKSAVEVWYESDYEYWEELSKDKKAYKEEKKRIAEATIQELDKRWPGLASQVEVIDVPTPHTYKRYTGNWKGSPDGWYLTTDNMRDQEPLRSVPGLEGLRMIGQWTAPYTGVVMAALTGRQAIQLMCKEEGRKFVSSPAQSFTVHSGIPLTRNYIHRSKVSHCTNF
jgi:phytoene dehydrogenase-like protein